MSTLYKFGIALHEALYQNKFGEAYFSLNEQTRSELLEIVRKVKAQKKKVMIVDGEMLQVFGLPFPILDERGFTWRYHWSRCCQHWSPISRFIRTEDLDEPALELFEFTHTN